MPKGSFKKLCAECYDTGYNLKNWLFIENMEDHYHNANDRHVDGERIPLHNLEREPKGYFVDKEGKVIKIKEKRRRQTTLSFAAKPKTDIIRKQSSSKQEMDASSSDEDDDNNTNNDNNRNNIPSASPKPSTENVSTLLYFNRRGKKRKYHQTQTTESVFTPSHETTTNSTGSSSSTTTILQSDIYSKAFCEPPSKKQRVHKQLTLYQHKQYIQTQRELTEDDINDDLDVDTKQELIQRIIYNKNRKIKGLEAKLSKFENKCIKNMSTYFVFWYDFGLRYYIDDIFGEQYYFIYCIYCCMDPSNRTFNGRYSLNLKQMIKSYYYLKWCHW